LEGYRGDERLIDELGRRFGDAEDCVQRGSPVKAEASEAAREKAPLVKIEIHARD
jgi:hypothetical protein